MRLVLALLIAPLVFAQSPSDFRIELQLLESRPYRQTELIPLQLRAVGRPSEPAEVPWQFRGFTVTPLLSDGTAECGTEAVPCFLRTGVISGRLDVDFNKQSDTSVTALNDYIPKSLVPGTYRIAALVRKPGPNSPELVLSNSVQIQVLPAAPQWIGGAIRDAVERAKDTEDYQGARNAAKQLALLDTPDAWAAALGLMPVQDDVLLGELSHTAQPKALCDLMQARIPLPAQAVSGRYLSTMTNLCVTANLPPRPVAAPGGRVGATISAARFSNAVVEESEARAYFEKQRAYSEELMARSTNALAASLGGKQAGAPTVEAMVTLLGYIRQLQANRPRGATPVWAAALASRIESVLPILPAEKRRGLVPLFASALPRASAATAFDAVLDQWKPGANIGMDLQDQWAALRALHRVDPRRAHARILAELAKKETWLQPKMLDMLPEEAVAPMDDALVDALVREQLPGLPTSILRASAIARYATAQALPRVREFLEARPARCEPELVAFLLRVDAPYAARMLQSISAPTCLMQYFERTAALIRHPVLEEFIVPYLMKGDVFLKTAAANSLGRYGSKAAKKPLWDAFQYFHEYWDGKAEELARNGEGEVLEEALSSALSRGQGWMLAEEELRAMEKLCIGQRCLYQVRDALNWWRSPVRLEVVEHDSGFSGIVGPYRLESLADLEAKLAQFPGGTRFQMSVTGPDAEAMEASLQRAAAGRGLEIESQ